MALIQARHDVSLAQIAWVTASTTVWSLASPVGGSAVLRSSAARLGPAARDQGRQKWWPEKVVCIH